MMRALLACAFALALPFAAHAAEPFQAGKEYALIDPPQPTATGSKVEVIEVFSYGCIHCAEFQPRVDAWKKHMPANVEFSYLPASFQPYFKLMARAYYTAEVLGVAERSHDAVFKAIFEEKKPMQRIEDIAQFYKAYGVKPEDFVAASNSFAVETKLRRADELTRRYLIDGTPTIVVNGKYRTSPDPAQAGAKVFEVVDYLIAKEQAKK